jgi:type I restriction enzyme R subunit
LAELLVLKYHALADAKMELGAVKGIREMFIGFQAGLYGGRVG